jgi:hypothetical protein
MLRSAALAGALIFSASCNKSEGGDSLGSPLAAGAGSSKPQGSGGSFSAELARELGAGTTKPAGPAARGSGAQGEVKAGEAKAGMKPDPGAKAGSESAGSAAVVADQGAKPEPGAKAGSDASSTGRPAPEVKSPPVSAPVSHGPVKVPADLAAIKLSLLPNWDRDLDAPGTFQYVVRIKGTQRTRTFTFRYGYDDPKAPADRDQYKKYLQDTRALTGEIRDRQRGAAWFLEGNDASGTPAFRYVVLYGGRRLICYGSLYKDAEGSRLGDDRDQTLIQAKQICETLAL